MLSVSFDNGAGVEGGGGGNADILKSVMWKNTKCIDKKVPNRRIIRKSGGCGGLWICAVFPVMLGLILSFPDGTHAGRTKKDGGSKNGNFSQSPTNHEEALNKHDTSSSSSSSGDDFWVGSHKLEFKPHPLLMPSTQSPVTSQIPIPIIELGQPTTSSSLTSSSNEAGEVSDDLSEAASSTDTDANESEKGKGKPRKSRGGRKKSRDQRRMAHRTLWSRNIQGTPGNSSGSNGPAYVMSGFQGNPYFLHNHHQLPHQQQQQQQQPVILTAGSMLSPQSPLLIPPLTNSRNGNSFHGSASTWNINHPGNHGGGGRIVGNQMQPQAQASYLPQNSGSSSSSQESSQSQQVQGPYASPGGGGGGGGGMYTYPEFLQHHQQQIAQQLGYSSQFAPQQQQSHGLQQPQIPLQFPPVIQGQPYPVMPSGPEYTAQQSLSPVVVSSNNGPVMMYMAHGSGSGVGQVPSASGPIPVKPFNINEIPSVGYPPHLQYNHLSSGPDYSQSSPGPHHSDPHQNYQNGGGGGGGGSSSGKSTTNPQYFRNNFLRMFMDKLVNVGKVLPIPFVTKYATSPSASPYPYPQQVQQQYQGYGRHGHFSRRMK